MGKLANGWALAKQSANVLMLDKQLLIFPLLSGLASLVVLASFAVPLVWTGWFAGAKDTPSADGLFYLALFGFYFTNYFVIVFFNTALVSCALQSFDGQDPSVAGGLLAAGRKLPQIAAWAFLAATVGFLLRLLEERLAFVGRLVAGLLGLAWTVGVAFVVPVLASEDVGPFEAVRRSTEVLKKSWGESIAGNFGIGLLVALLGIVALVPGVAGIYFFTLGRVGLGFMYVGATAVALVLVAMVSSALNTILTAALYRYATGGKVPEAFDPEVLARAFVPR